MVDRMEEVENWQHTPEQLQSFSDTELSVLVLSTPIRDEYRLWERRHLLKKEEYLLSAYEKGRRHRCYKDTLREFKEKSSLLCLSLQRQRPPMTPELLAVRRRKEELYASFKEEMQRYRQILNEAQDLYNIMDNVYSRYRVSMECFVICLLRERLGSTRFALDSLRYEQYDFRRFIGRQNRLNAVSPISYTVVHLTREEFNTETLEHCPICMDVHIMGQTVFTCCGHRFGTDCLSMWHTRRFSSGLCVNCPICKKNGVSLTQYAILDDSIPRIDVLESP